MRPFGRDDEPPLSLCLRLLSLRRTGLLRAGFSPEFLSALLVLLPESFRGGCSFGTVSKRLLPTGDVVSELSIKPRAWQGANVVATQKIVASGEMRKIAMSLADYEIASSFQRLINNNSILYGISQELNPQVYSTSVLGASPLMSR